MKTWQFKESINMRECIRPRWGMWYYVGNRGHRNRSKSSKLDVLVQYGPGKHWVVAWDGAMRSFVWHLWPWYLADELSVSRGPESLSGFPTSTRFFFYSCHFSPSELLLNWSRAPTAERRGSQATDILMCWKHEISSWKWHPQGQRTYPESSSPLAPSHFYRFTKRSVTDI